jgi:ribonuclease HI
MKAYINAFSTGKTKTAKFAVLLEDGESFIYEIEGSMNAAEIYAARFVINGTDKNLEIFTSSKYLITMLEKKDGDWAKNAVKNKELIQSLRDEVSSCNALSIEFDKDSDEMKKARELARV